MNERIRSSMQLPLTFGFIFSQATDYLLRQPSYLLGGNLLGLGGAMAGALGGEQDDLARALAMSLGENVTVSTDPTNEGPDGRPREAQVRLSFQT